MQKRVFLPQRSFLNAGTRCSGSGSVPLWLTLLLLLWGVLPSFGQATVTIDPAARQQVMDGFGTCLSGGEGETAWMQNLYYDDAGCSILRVDMVPRFASPYSDNTYNSPWFHNNPPLPGPDGNNVRTYTGAADYTRLFNNNRAQIAVMGPDIAANILKFDYSNVLPRAAGAMAKAGASRKAKLGDFKLTASIWSPAPWLKVTSGNKYGGSAWPLPTANVPFPFIWADNFTGGKLDVSNTPRAEFFDGVQNTSALTQFARSTAAYVKGFQDLNGVQFYSLSIQNELNFETFYNSATYPLSSYYITALKAVRAEFNKYTDLRNIRLIGPEDLLGGDAYGLWQYGNSANTVGDLVVHKNLQYLTEIAKDPAATAAIDYYCIHGYASDGVNSAGSNASLWDWWANGWGVAPVGGIPDNVKGFRFYNKKSWMTETSGEEAPWLAPSTGFPNNGAFSVALKMHQAIVNGFNSAWIYWQFSDGAAVGGSTLTDATAMGGAAKYNSFKHFSKYIRPNAVRLGTSSTNSGVSASSYVQDTDKSLTVVLINSNATAQSVTVNVPALAFTISSFNAYTSSNNSYWQSATLAVSQNRVSLTIPAYGVVTLYGTGTTTTPPVTLRTPENPASTTAGVEYKYYEGTWSVLPNFDALTAVKSGNVANFDMSVRNRTDNYGFKYTGFVQVPTDGTYTFYTSSDDGSKLYIGTTEVVNNDGLHGLQERSGTIGLKAGKHAISVTFFEATGGEGLTVSYAGPGITKGAIPNAALSRASGTTPTPGTFSGTYKLTARHSGKALDVNGGATADGANVQQWTDNGSTAQQWIITATTDGHYRLVCKASGKALEVSNNALADGGNVQQWSYVGGNSQQWKIEATTDGFYRLLNRNSGKALDVNGNSTADGANVHQWTYGGGLNQQWLLTQLSTATARKSFEAPAAETVSLFPNPVRDGVLHVKVQATEAGKAVLALSGATGGRTLRKDFAVRRGANLLKVNTHGLPSGLYFLSVQHGARKTVKKVVIGN
jgi:O-glycosyl hydrolase